MIGYMVPPEPSASDRALFRGYQCGLCHVLGAEYGFAYRLFAGVDLVFFNIFLDLHTSTRAAEGRRACVLSPFGERGPGLRARQATEHARFAAAFGVWVGVEKLRDDAEDEGGILRALALRAFTPGQARAREVLERRGFPIAEAEAWMRTQRAIEATPRLGLEQAAQPTQQIARLLFESAACSPEERTRAARLGEHTGLFLFALDNLLDLGRDLRSRQYNALARAFGLESHTVGMPEEVRTAGLDLARRAVAGVQEEVAGLPLDDHGRYVRRALARSFTRKIEAFEALPVAALPGVRLQDLRPGREPLRARLARIVHRTWAGAAAGVRLAVAMLALALFPSWKTGQRLALEWGRPAFADSGDSSDSSTPDDSRGGEDTGDSGVVLEDPAVERPCDLCCDFEDDSIGKCTPEWLDRLVERACEVLCIEPCTNVCNSACDQACTNLGCDNACDNSCSGCVSSGGDNLGGKPGC